MIANLDELESFMEKNGTEMYDNTPRFTIQFGFPIDGKATLHLNKSGIEMVVINCFTWNQTLGMRRRFSFGDNHKSRPLNWLDTVRVLKETIRLIERKVELV